MNMVLRPTFGRISHNFSQNQNVLFFKNLHFWLLSEILKSDCNFKISFMMYLTIINTPPLKRRWKMHFRISYFHGIQPTYRTSSAETCTKIAFEIEDDQCQRACHYHGHLKCQECIEENLPDQCSELSGATNTSLKWVSRYHFMLFIRVFLLVLQLPNIARVCPVPNCSPRPIRSHRLHQVQADSPWLHLLHLYPPLLLGAGRSSV